MVNIVEVLKEKENYIEEYWKKIKLKEIIEEENKKRKKKFWLLDGPPYPNDEPHVGHARNLTIKDFMLKYKFLKGYQICFRPGFDTHGLPIEVKVESKLNIKNKKEIEEKVGIDKFIEECRSFALGNESKWIEFYRKIGHWYALHENPYLTLSKEYIESCWYIFKEIYKKGLVYFEKRPVWWCPRCQTTLSGYEVVDEYTNIEDPSIYVLFPLADEKNTYLLVWTTTPWTLCANVAIAVHPEEIYVKVEVNNKKVIIAKNRLEFLDKLGVNYKVLEEFFGKDLNGKKYYGVIENDIQKELDNSENGHKVIMSIEMLKGFVGAKILAKKELEELNVEYEHFVNVNEGTGLVHVAPGHGKEDFEIGRYYNLPAYSPVNDEGIMEVDPVKGVYFRDANKKIIEYLKEKGFLFHEEKIIHRYPLCWRCKTPLIIRLHEDLFISIRKIKENMLNFIKDKIRFYPEFCRDRMINWVANEEDWDISRQRYWGIPIPIWKCKNCENIKVIGSIEELERECKGQIKIDDLHRNIVDKIVLRCEKCGGDMFRINDVFDVWFDSGCATFASEHYPFEGKEKFERFLWRVDFVVEGQDQIRGWFDKLLNISVAAFGDYPYNSIMTLGWVVDEKGQKMSKKLGNVVWAIEAWNKLGASILRAYELWKASPWETISFSLKEAEKEIGKMFNIFINVNRYIIERGREVGIKIKNIKKEDLYLISAFNSLIKKLDDIVENKGRLNDYVREIERFGVDIVSRFYIKLVRERVQINKDSTPIGILLDVWKKFLILLAPVSPHLAEYLYQELNREFMIGKITIFKESYPKVEENKINKDLEDSVEIARKIVEDLLHLRNIENIKLRYTLKFVVLPENIKDKVKDLELFETILKEMVNVKKIIYSSKEVEGCIYYDAGYGKIGISKEIDEELSFVSEFCRMVQENRKKLKYRVDQELILLVDVEDNKIKEILNRNKKFIEKRTNCKVKFSKDCPILIKVMNKELKIGFKEKKEGIIKKIIDILKNFKD